MSEIAFDPIEDLVADIKAGRMVIITTAAPKPVMD